MPKKRKNTDRFKLKLKELDGFGGTGSQSVDRVVGFACGGS